MQSLRSISPIVRAIGVIGAVAILVTAVTFAALQSQATLTNNTIASANAVLHVDNVDDGVEAGLTTDEGFAFTGIIPGSTPSNVGNFTLFNAGAAGDAALDIGVEIPTLPTWDETVDPDKVYVEFDCTGGFTATDVVASLTALDAAGGVALGGSLALGATATCTAEVSMDADAFTADGTTTTVGFDLLFTGTGV